MKRWVPRLVVFLVTACGIAAALMASWVTFSLRYSVPGWRFGIGNAAGDGSKTGLLSFGIVTAALCVVGFIAYLMKFPRVLASTGVGMLLLSTGALLQIAFADTAILEDLIRDQMQYRGAEVFAHRNLPMNLGTEPSRRRILSTSAIGDRIYTTQFFMGLAWYVTISVGVIGTVSGIRGLPSWRWRHAAIFLGVMAHLALVALCLLNPIRAQRAVTRALQLESDGDLNRATEEYRRAMRLDSLYTLDPFVQERIGAIDSATGRTNTPEYGIYQSDLFVQQNDLPSAIAELEKLLRKEGDAAPPILRKRMADLWTLNGRRLYQAGAIGDASIAWQSALLYDPRQMLAGFCLTTAYYDLGRYQESVDLIASLLKKCADPQMQGNLLSNQGDAYTKLGKLNEAHLAYRASYKLDSILNWRALTALVGGN